MRTRDGFNTLLVHQREHFSISPEGDSTRGSQRRLYMQSMCYRRTLELGFDARKRPECRLIESIGVLIVTIQ